MNIKYLHYILISVLILLSNIVVIKAEEDKLYYMHQKEGTEAMLNKYLSIILKSKGVDTEEISEIYANFIPPMGCPRCEGMVILYNKMLEEATEGKAFIINILLYKKEKALNEYIFKQKFNENFFYVDTTDIFTEIFAVNREQVMVPYLSKISLLDGRTVASFSTLGIHLDGDFVTNMINKSDYSGLCTNYINNQKVESPIALSFKIESIEELKKLSLNKIFPTPTDTVKIYRADTLSIVNKFSINKNGDKLIVDDFLSNSFILFSKNNDKWENPIKLLPSQEEEKMFVDNTIDDFIYQYIKDMNILVSMYLNAFFIENNLFITASLPKLIMEVVDSNPNLSYYNTPICLVKNLQGINIKQYDFSDIDISEKYGYSFNHYDTNFFEDDNLFVFKLSKGWPVSGTSSLPSNVKENPFLEEFYDDSKTLLFYNPTTQKYIIAGELDDFYKKIKIGYYASSPLVKKFNSKYYYVDILLGKIYVFSDNFENCTLLYDFFELESKVDKINIYENITYFEEVEKRYFTKHVADYFVLPDNSYKILVKDADNHYIYSVQNNEINIATVFPNKINEQEKTELRFGKDEEGNLIVYGLFQNNQEIVIYTFKL